MTEDLPYDPLDPPVDPPAGCTDPVLWRVARTLLDSHHPRPDNFCDCRAFWPCPAAKLAEEALQMACERPVPVPRMRRTSNIGRWSR